MNPLSKKQQDLLQAIETFLTFEGRPPSLRELAKELGVKAVGTIQDHVRALKKKGYLDSRSEHLKLTYQSQARSIPILGAVPAGSPLDAVAEILGSLSVSLPPPPLRLPRGATTQSQETSIHSIQKTSSKTPKKSETTALFDLPSDLYALRVRGDSMEGAAILDGDYVLVSARAEVRHGDIVVAMIDGEVTVKRLYQKAGRTELLPENPKYSPIAVPAESFNLIQGKVVGLQRYLSQG